MLTAFAAGLLGCAALPATLEDEAPEVRMLDVRGASLELQFAPGLAAAQLAWATAWVMRCAEAVAAYFGRFPLPQIEVLVVVEAGERVLGGASFAEPSPLLRLRLGDKVTQAALNEDWILVHEMVHLAVPRLARAHNWLHEGLATYIEGLARGRAGWVGAQAVWHSWTRQMPLGQPRPGEAGLDQTPTWARTYWGGALFCLLADVRLRQQGSPQRGLQQALQGVLAAGGDFRVVWPVTQVFACADAALGQTTLRDLYAAMKDDAVAIDLAALWRDLGVGETTLHDNAPLAAIRRAILA